MCGWSNITFHLLQSRVDARRARYNFVCSYANDVLQSYNCSFMEEWRKNHSWRLLPEYISRVAPKSVPAVSFASSCPIPLGSVTQRRSPVATDEHKIHSKSPLLCRHAVWLSRQRHVFHFEHDAMSSCRRVSVVPSTWMLVVQTVYVRLWDACQKNNNKHTIYEMS